MKLVLSRVLLAAATLALLGARPACADAVTEWNQIMQATVAPSNAVIQSRSAAIVQLAVFEAVNTITGDYEPYLGTLTAPPGASPEAAAVAAAYRTLVTLYPASAVALGQARALSLDAIDDGPGKDAGIAVGEQAALQLLQLRANDGAGLAALTPYAPGNSPVDWQPTPPAFAKALLPGWGSVTPFGLNTPDQFRAAAPPPLNSGKYAGDYNETRLLGRAGINPFRPQDRADVALFYDVTSPVFAWNTVARQVSAAQGKSLSENARIFALLGMAIGDAAIAVFESKYHYNLWRPVTAIWGGDLDGNLRTAADAAWLPLVGTRPFPTYPSAHATLSGAARVTLERLFGRQGHSIVLSNAALTLSYTSFRQICDDVDDARIYGGIHFRFDQEAGTLQGRQVATYLSTHYLRPTRPGPPVQPD